MTNDGDIDTGSSPNQGTNIVPTSTGQSAPSANQGDFQNGGGQQQANMSQAAGFQDVRPAINTIYTKKSYNLDAVEVLVGVSTQTGQWEGIKYEYWIRQLLEAFVTNNIEDEREKSFLARSKIDSSNNNTIKAFIESCKPISEAQTFSEFRRLLSNVMIKGVATNYLEAFSNFKKIIWSQNLPIYGFFTKLSDAIEEYAMLMYTQTREMVSERIKRSLILAQFLEQCPMKWHSRIVEVSNLDLNTSDQIKQILDATKHELLTNKWSNNEVDEQIAYMNRGRSDTKGQRQMNNKNANRGRSLSRNRAPIVCYNCYKKGHVKKDCRSPTYCQACRDERKPVSVECKNSWKYAQLNREHTKERGNNYRHEFQERKGNQVYERSSNQYRNPQRG